jgi:hypothetical protein
MTSEAGLIAPARSWIDAAQRVVVLTGAGKVHGTIRRVMCWGGGVRTTMQSVLKRVQDGEADPPCRG